jgi:hypothetical protein
MALVAWSLFVWSTRISNAWSDAHASTASKWGATLLSLSFVALSAATVVVLVRSRHRVWQVAEARLLEVFAGWTTAVWLVFGTLILVHDHPVAFKAVHVTLGLISIGLSYAVARSAERAMARAARADTAEPVG